MGPKTKKIKLDQGTSSSQQKTKFLDMNDDCILEICKYLPDPDLFSMRYTCKRLHGLAAYHIQHKHSEKWVNIVSKRDYLNGSKVVFDIPDNNYHKRLRPHIKNVHMIGKHVRSPYRFFGFLKLYCFADVKQLKLENLKGALNINTAKLIDGKLDALESITINDFRTNHDIYDDLLKYCTSLKHLSIRTVVEGNTAWLTRSIPTLASLELDFGDEFHRKKFSELGKQFLESFEHLEEITCHSNAVLGIVLSTVKKLKRLTLHFSCYSQFNEIFNDLKCYCDNETTESLEIFLPVDEPHPSINTLLDELERLKPLSVLYNLRLDEVPISDGALRLLNKLKRLKLLFHFPVVDIIDFASKLPNLIDIEFFIDAEHVHEEIITDLLRPLLINAKNLQTIKIITESWNFYRIIWHGLYLLKNVRPNDAIKTTIHLEVPDNDAFLSLNRYHVIKFDPIVDVRYIG